LNSPAASVFGVENGNSIVLYHLNKKSLARKEKIEKKLIIDYMKNKEKSLYLLPVSKYSLDSMVPSLGEAGDAGCNPKGLNFPFCLSGVQMLASEAQFSSLIYQRSLEEDKKGVDY
jgi:hypothetical protein